MFQLSRTTARARRMVLAGVVAASTLGTGLSVATQAGAAEQPNPVGCGGSGCSRGFDVLNATGQTLTPTSAHTHYPDPNRSDSWESPSGWESGTPKRGDLLLPNKVQRWELYYGIHNAADINTGTVEYSLSGGGQVEVQVHNDSFNRPFSWCTVKNTDKVKCVAHLDQIVISPA